MTLCSMANALWLGLWYLKVSQEYSLSFDMKR
jgi:hypothetical protein